MWIILICIIIIMFLITLYTWIKLFLFDLFTFSILNSDFNLFSFSSSLTFIWTIFYSIILNNNYYFYSYILFTIFVIVYLIILMGWNNWNDEIEKIEEDVKYASILDIIWNVLVIIMIFITILYNHNIWLYSIIIAIVSSIFVVYFIKNYVNYFIKNSIITENEILNFWLYDYYNKIYNKEWKKWLLKELKKMFKKGITYKVMKDKRKESKKFIPLFPVIVM